MHSHAGAWERGVLEHENDKMQKHANEKTRESRHRENSNPYWFPRSCVVTLRCMHSHAGAWERGVLEHENDKMQKHANEKTRESRHRENSNPYWFPRSCVVTLRCMHSHAGAWERGVLEHENDKMQKHANEKTRESRHRENSNPYWLPRSRVVT